MLFLARYKSLQSRSKNVIYNSILSLICKFISILLSFISTPLLLTCLGQEKYGIWASVLSIISWIYYFDFGIGSGVRNKLASSIALKDYITAKNVICLGYVLTSIISILLVLFVAILLVFFDLSSFFEFNITEEKINFVFFIACLFACINFVASLVNNLFFALQKAAVVSFFNILGQLFFVLALLLFLVTENKLLLYVALAEGWAQLLKNLIANFYAFLKNKDLRFSLKNLNFSYSKFIMTFGLQMFVLQIAALTLNCTDNIIISKYFGPFEVTPYDICYKCFALVNTFFVIFLSPLVSAYTEAYTKKDYSWIIKTLTNSFYLYVGFLIILVVFALLFKTIAMYWLRTDLNYSYSLIFLIALYFALLMFTHIFSSLLVGIGAIHEASFAMICEAIINIPISIYLAKYLELGVNGVILGSICCMIIAVIVFPYKGLKIIFILKQNKINC